MAPHDLRVFFNGYTFLLDNVIAYFIVLPLNASIYFIKSFMHLECEYLVGLTSGIYAQG